MGSAMHTPASLYHCAGGLASCHVDEKTLTKPRFCTWISAMRVCDLDRVRSVQVSVTRVYPANLSRSLPQVEVMFGGPPMALLSHQERPNASLRANPPPIVSSEASTCPE